MACFQQARVPKTRPRSCRSRCRASSAGRKTPKRTGVQPYMSVYQSLPTACPCSFRPKPPLLEAKPQNAATHCYYRAPKLLDSFQQAQMPKTSPGSFRSRCRVSPPGAKLQKAATHCFYRKLLDSHWVLLKLKPPKRCCHLRHQQQECPCKTISAIHNKAVITKYHTNPLKLGPSWSQLARVRRKLGSSWAQVSSYSAQLKAKDSQVWPQSAFGWAK